MPGHMESWQLCICLSYIEVWLRFRLRSRRLTTSDPTVCKCSHIQKINIVFFPIIMLIQTIFPRLGSSITVWCDQISLWLICDASLWDSVAFIYAQFTELWDRLQTQLHLSWYSASCKYRHELALTCSTTWCKRRPHTIVSSPIHTHTNTRTITPPAAVPLPTCCQTPLCHPEPFCHRVRSHS